MPPEGCHFRPSQKGGDQVGLTLKGKGAKLMLVVDNQGIPLGALVASAQRAEITLAEATLATVLGNGEGTAAQGTTPQSSQGTGSRPGLRFSSIPKPVAAEGNQALHPGKTWQKAATRQESSGVQLPPSVGSGTDLRLVAQLSSAGSSIREKSASLFRLRPAGLCNPAH